MSHWTQILTKQEIEAYHTMTAKLDPAFARQEREWFERQTKAKLETEASYAWQGNQGHAYQLARSYAALKD